eukprot:5043972-Amphidinium_carterae.2
MQGLAAERRETKRSASQRVFELKAMDERKFTTPLEVVSWCMRAIAACQDMKQTSPMEHALLSSKMQQRFCNVLTVNIE